MKFDFLDKNVSIQMNAFVIIANIINLWYNIPQVIKTYKCKSTRDFSSWFLFLRIIGNTIWIAYAVEVDSFQMLLNNIVTVLASTFIAYYKVKEIYIDYKKKNKKYEIIENINMNTNKNIIVENIDDII
jgi:MtN3 and saliva related transmembrane protein